MTSPQPHEIPNVLAENQTANPQDRTHVHQDQTIIQQNQTPVQTPEVVKPPEGLYPWHPQWNAILKSPSYGATLKNVKAAILQDKRREFDSWVYELSGPEEWHLKKTIKLLTKEHYDIMISKMQNMDKEGLRRGLIVLGGRHSYLKAHTHAFRAGDIKFKERERIHHLPPELFDAIKIATFDAAFLGPIFLHERLGATAPKNKGIGADINISALGRINHLTRIQNADRIIAENLWVVGPGGCQSIYDVFDRLSEGIRGPISRLHLTFAREDFYLPRRDDEYPEPNCDEWLLFMGARRGRVLGCDRWQQLLCDEWIDKAILIGYFELDGLKELTLDLRDAYAPDGRYLGRRIANCMHAFGEIQGKLLELKIMAPTEELARTCERILIDEELTIGDLQILLGDAEGTLSGLS